MTGFGLLLRSLRYFWRTNLGVVLGAACSAAVLVGALAVGDSVRYSLRTQAEARIGQVDAALLARERFLRADLAGRLATDLGDARLAAMLRLEGIASTRGGAKRAGIVDVLGVDDNFFALAPAKTRRAAPAPGKAFVNRRLARHLGVTPGDDVLVRVEKPSYVPRDVAMSTIEDVSFAVRVRVSDVIGDDEFGRFGLRASQIPPFNLFVSRAWLQQQLGFASGANVILVAGGGDSPADTVRNANAALSKRLSLADIGVAVERLAGKRLFELDTDRVFLEDAVVDAVKSMSPNLVGILTYFVNELRYGDRSTPYSMIAAIGKLNDVMITDPGIIELLRIVPDDLRENDIVLNDWVAKDLEARRQVPIRIEFYVMGPRLGLAKKHKELYVHSIVPLAGAAQDPSLMPAFPGLHDSENCRDWEPGIPIDLNRIRDKDENYWDDYRGTPKAFVSLATGQALWGNRFGRLTAIRGPIKEADRIEKELARSLDPGKLGFFFRDLRGPALEAGTSATDFGGLFLGLSFFLIVAALLLTSLLFVFGVEQRAQEIGTLLAIGFRPRGVRRLFLGEAALLATIGSVLGAGLGLGYAKAVLWGLGTLWQGAVGATTLHFEAGIGTVALGTGLAIAAALGSIWLALRKAFDRSAVELLSSKHGISQPVAKLERRTTRRSVRLAVVLLVLAIALVVVVGPGSNEAAGAFFGAGALALLSALLFCRAALFRFGRPSALGLQSLASLGVRNTGRRPGRSLATIALLASGTFLVVSVQANRLEPPRDFAVPESGTGGFALFGRSTLPVLRDLDTDEGREAYGLERKDLAGASILPARVREGDDASCLNLSLPTNPRLVGLRAARLANRESFSFTHCVSPDERPWLVNPWNLLDADFGPDVVPAIGDQASITWTLHKKVGDDLDYVDEQGRAFKVRIVGALRNSILQGNLIVSEHRLRQRYPSISGYRMFLIDVHRDRVQGVASRLTDALEDIGLELTSTRDRLAAFNAVQNTYLLIFQALGGLGLLLGSVGLGMVVLRNALERRGELAIAAAVGFRAAMIRRLVWTEHGILLALGLGAGAAAALLAVIPGVQTGGLSVIPMLVLVALVAASGAAWVWIASRLATRGPLLDALHED